MPLLEINEVNVCEQHATGTGWQLDLIFVDSLRYRWVYIFHQTTGTLFNSTHTHTHIQTLSLFSKYQAFSPGPLSFLRITGTVFNFSLPQHPLLFSAFSSPILSILFSQTWKPGTFIDPHPHPSFLTAGICSKTALFSQNTRHFLQYPTGNLPGKQRGAALERRFCSVGSWGSVSPVAAACGAALGRRVGYVGAA